MGSFCDQSCGISKLLGGIALPWIRGDFPLDLQGVCLLLGGFHAAALLLPFMFFFDHLSNAVGFLQMVAFWTLELSATALVSLLFVLYLELKYNILYFRSGSHTTVFSNMELSTTVLD